MRQVLFYKVRNFTAKNAMSVTNRKEMSATVFSKVRHHQVLVLVNFVWIFGREARLGGKRKLRDTVIVLLD